MKVTVVTNYPGISLMNIRFKILILPRARRTVRRYESVKFRLGYRGFNIGFENACGYRARSYGASDDSAQPRADGDAEGVALDADVDDASADGVEWDTERDEPDVGAVGGWAHRRSLAQRPSIARARAHAQTHAHTHARVRTLSPRASV